MAGTARFISETDRSISTGTWTYSFNPSGDPLGSEVEEVRYRLFIDYNNGASVDLADIEIFIEAPDGDRDNIYDNAESHIWPFPDVDDDDDGNDSDDTSDYDISFWGTDTRSKTAFNLDGAPVNGTWKLIVENETGKTLDLSFLEVWVDYSAPADLVITDVDIIGTQEVGQPVIIKADIDNTGDEWYAWPITLEYLVNGDVIGTSLLPGGLLAGDDDNTESELHTFVDIGDNAVQVRIAGGKDLDTSNNSRTEYFRFDHNEPDLAVTDISILGNGEAGSVHSIAATVTNVGNATYWDDVLLEYLVDDEVIGTQTIGLGPISGIPKGWLNDEFELYTFPKNGTVDVEVRIANPNDDDWDDSNNSLSRSFEFAADATNPDLVVSDVRIRGDWNTDDTVTIDAYFENIGNESWSALAGSADVEYFVRYDGDTEWTSVGTDTINPLGLTTLLGTWQTHDFTLAKDAPAEVKVTISGDDFELRTSNNSWEESFGHSRDGETQKTIVNSTYDVKLAAFLARAVYGEGDVPAAYQQDTINGLNDDYNTYLRSIGYRALTDVDFGTNYRPVDQLSTFFDGGLYAGDQGLASSDSENWQAQGLVALGFDDEGNRTLTLTFRGTDEEDRIEALVGQAWTGDGLYDYYESMRPLIDATLAYANDPTNAIEKVIVSGHSLGAATADAFSLVDAHRLNSDIDLTVVAFASPGIDISFLTDAPLFKGMAGQYASDIDIEIGVIEAPSFQISLAHNIDPVAYPAANPQPWYNTPNFTLLSNFRLVDALTTINLPNIENADRPGTNFGAGHNGGLYWANISQIMDDALLRFYDDHSIIAGITDLSKVKDMNGDAFGVFTDYVNYGAFGADSDSDDRALIGNTLNNFLLGFSGDDELNGGAGDDLLSGGADDDVLAGANGNDYLSGGSGDDNLRGQNGDDILIDGIGQNSAEGGDGDDTVILHSGINSATGGSDNDILIGGIQADVLDGGTGNDIIMGEASRGLLGGSDFITGGTGDDMLMGARGVDVFIFARNDGTDIIAKFSVADATAGGTIDADALSADFVAGIDQIQLTDFNATDSSNVLAAVRNGANGAIFEAEGTSITFFGVEADQLSADDFLFV